MSTEPVDDMWFTLGGNSVHRQTFNDGSWVVLGETLPTPGVTMIHAFLDGPDTPDGEDGSSMFIAEADGDDVRTALSSPLVTAFTMVNRDVARALAATLLEMVGEA